MLKLIDGTPEGGLIDTDDFYITHKSNGLDELVFNLSIYDPAYASLREESVIEYGQSYLVKAIDSGGSTAKVKCQLNLDDWKNTLIVGYSNGSATLRETVDGVLPEGWVFDDQSGIAIRRTIEGDYTPYDVLSACMDTYSVVFRFDVKGKKITAYTLANFEPNGAFASRDLNLKEINYKGKSSSFATRLYAYGKDGLTFAEINDGKPYVDNHMYSDKIICTIWEDDRYTDPESLLAAASERLAGLAIPERSYECSVLDLKAADPELYEFQDFSLFSVVRLIDDIREESVLYQVVERQEYPYYPEKNTVTLSSTAPTIQDTVKSLSDAIGNQSSGFWTIVKTAIDSGASWVSGGRGGYVQIRQDTDGMPVELLVMDSKELADAAHLLRLDMSGVAMSHTGYAGPWIPVLPMSGDYLAIKALRLVNDTDVLELAGNNEGLAVNKKTIVTRDYLEDEYVETDTFQELSGRVEDAEQDILNFRQETTDLGDRVEELEDKVSTLEALTEELKGRLEALEQA